MKEILAEIGIFIMVGLAIVFFTVCGWLGIGVDE